MVPGTSLSDCPTIGPDGECCRCIGQALLIITHPVPATPKCLSAHNRESSCTCCWVYEKIPVLILYDKWWMLCSCPLSLWSIVGQGALGILSHLGFLWHGLLGRNKLLPALLQISDPSYELTKTSHLAPQLFHFKLKTLLFYQSYPDSSSSPYLSPCLNSKHYTP